MLCERLFAQHCREYNQYYSTIRLRGVFFKNLSQQAVLMFIKLEKATLI